MLQLPATRISMLQLSATWISMLQLSATWISMIQLPATWISMLQLPATWISMLQLSTLNILFSKSLQFCEKLNSYNDNGNSDWKRISWFVKVVKIRAYVGQIRAYMCSQIHAYICRSDPCLFRLDPRLYVGQIHTYM